MLVTFSPLRDLQGAPIAVIATSVEVAAAVRDRHQLSEVMLVVEQKSAQLLHQTLHDSLTGLPNRQLIMDRAEQMLVRTRRQHLPTAAMFLHLDNFKCINDTFGHAAGDELLRAVASRLRHAVRAPDTVGRLGGDEFVVLAEGPSLDAGSTVMAERLLEVIRRPVTLKAGNKSLHAVTASIGVADGDRARAKDLLHDADLALYIAKAAGRNQCARFASSKETAAITRRTDYRRASYLYTSPLTDGARVALLAETAIACESLAFATQVGVTVNGRARITRCHRSWKRKHFERRAGRSARSPLISVMTTKRFARI